VQALLSRLPPADAAQVQDIWDALLTARRDCEAMAARGVRVSRDISRDWQETVSDLIDRVVAQDSELGTLRQQVDGRTGRAKMSCTCMVATAHGYGQHMQDCGHEGCQRMQDGCKLLPATPWRAEQACCFISHRVKSRMLCSTLPAHSLVHSSVCHVCPGN
jgi:hypothetical protein